MVFFITSLQFKSLFVSSSTLHIDQFVKRDFSRGIRARARTHASSSATAFRWLSIFAKLSRTRKLICARVFLVGCYFVVFNFVCLAINGCQRSFIFRVIFPLSPGFWAACEKFAVISRFSGAYTVPVYKARSVTSLAQAKTLKVFMKSNYNHKLLWQN